MNSEYYDGFKKVLMGINEILITDDVESVCQSFLDESLLYEKIVSSFTIITVFENHRKKSPSPLRAKRAKFTF